jgi:hypothetical protein
MIRKHFRLKKIALGLAFAAVVVPTAQARVVIDSAPVSQGTAIKLTGAALVNAPAPVSQTVQLTGAALVNAPAPVSQAVQAPLSQLQVEGMRWEAMARQYESRPGITAAGAALSNARHDAYPAPVIQTQTATSDGFNWSDAGVGALVAFGAALMLVTAFVLSRRHRSGPTGLVST